MNQFSRTAEHTLPANTAQIERYSSLAYLDCSWNKLERMQGTTNESSRLCEALATACQNERKNATFMLIKLLKPAQVNTARLRPFFPA